ncbi:uncharacterized protein PAC_16340 [Phialocephala subalpina]|uniref:DUF7587 domain-containing protein n=1 Tax=Phialocephala subalpina TaxID=576137 RepID=A0A1L7XN20_9HELO|nr:uncharacterized protein PAC_16340 [Phialocephala subalpina]
MAPDSPSRILFRTWSYSSAGTNSRRGFRSGDRNCRVIDDFELAEHFENHSNLNNRTPTCLISTTDDPVRALRYAINLQAQGEDDNDVHISIIRSNRYVRGENFATLFDPENERLFKTEFLFFWEIKPTEILHVVSLDTLVGNGLLNRFKVLDPEYWVGGTLPLLWTVRNEICRNNEEAWSRGDRSTWPERSGRYVAAIAKCFGNGAPHRAIASLTWHHGTHFKPNNYENWGLDLRVRDAIQEVLDRNGNSRWYDQWCGELASV